MSFAFVRKYAAASLQNFLMETPPEVVSESHGDHCLMDYVARWVESGKGVRTCTGNFQMYLFAIIAIIDEWVTDPRILRYLTNDDEAVEVPRHVDSILGDDLFHRAFDQEWFAQQVYYYHENR